jgi:threonine synthase
MITPLIKLPSDWSKFGIKSAYIKDEGKNPFGTIKDRRNSAIVKEAARLKVDKLVLITSGNNGYSLAQYAKNTPIKVVCVVNKDLPEETKKQLKNTAYQVIELNLNHKILRPEEIVAFARETDDEVIWEVTNGYDDLYSPILEEIIGEIESDYLIVPVGSGGIFVSMAEAIERLSPRTKLIGIGVQNTIHSIADKLSTPWSPYTKAVQAYQKHGHFMYRLSELEIKKTFHEFQNVVNCEPSSAVVFAALYKHKFKDTDIVVFLNSGTTIMSK